MPLCTLQIGSFPPMAVDIFLCEFMRFCVIVLPQINATSLSPCRSLRQDTLSLNGCHGCAQGDSNVTSQWNFVSLQHADTKLE